MNHTCVYFPRTSRELTSSTKNDTGTRWLKIMFGSEKWSSIICLQMPLGLSNVMKLVSKFILGTFYFPEQTRHLISCLPPNSVQATVTVYPVWLCFDSCHVTLWILRRTLELVLQTTCRAGQFPLISIVKRTPGATVTNTKRWIIHSSVIPNAKSLPIWFH